MRIDNHNLITRIVVAFIITYATVFSSIELRAQDYKFGYNFSGYNFSSEKSIPLIKDWDFYWMNLIPPDSIDYFEPSAIVSTPHLWNTFEDLGSFGYATYRTTIKLPTDFPLLGLNIPDLYSSYEVYINGKLLAANGVVAKSKELYTPVRFPQLVPIENNGADTLEILIQIANFDHSKGGVRLPLEIGAFSVLSLNREAQLTYAWALAGSLFMGGLFFLGLYMYGRNEISILYFSLFCLVYSYRLFGTDLYPLHILFPELSWILTLRLEYLTLFIAAPLFGLFLKNLFKEESQNLVFNAFNAFFILFSFITLFLSPFHFTRLLEPFFAILVIYIIFALSVIVKAVINKKQGSLLALFSMLVIFSVFIENLLQYLVIIDENLGFSFVGYIIFFFSSSLILSSRFASSFKKAKDEAESALVSKNNFLATMGHELRTPLNAVIGFSELLAYSTSDKERVDYANTIKKSGEALLQLINNILDYSKMEAGKVSIDKIEINLHKYLTENVEILSSLTQAKDLKISLKIDQELPAKVFTDPYMLRQILFNIIGNAIKFTEKGDIFVHCSLANEQVEEPQLKLLFSVKDTGIGIPEEEYSNMFDSFTQVESSISRKYSGTGLGLSISKKLVEMLDGQIWVKSTLGKGTTFYFTLVVEKPETESPPQIIEASKVTQKSGINVLLVEDNIINQKVAIKMLERLNVFPDLAENGLEAVEKCEAKEYDLIFMDLEMPEMNGIEATKVILNSQSHSKKPLIYALTANNTVEIKKQCMEAGMKDFLTKPIKIETLERVLESLN